MEGVPPDRVPPSETGSTLTVSVSLSSTEQPDEAFAASMLNVVVDVRLPVGSSIVPPVPGTGEPTLTSPASFLSW